MAKCSKNTWPTSHRRNKKVEKDMSLRSSPNQLKTSDDLQQLQELVVDKRYGKRAKAKKNRRNRHYEKQFMRNAVSTGILVGGLEDVSEES